MMLDWLLLFNWLFFKILLMRRHDDGRSGVFERKVYLKNFVRNVCLCVVFIIVDVLHKCAFSAQDGSCVRVQTN